MMFSISGVVKRVSSGVFKASGLAALLVIATLATSTPARAQSSDTWKSIAIIGGSTAAGAYIGHKVAGTTGAYVGAAVGATAGYAIDRRRRQNEYYNNDYSYGAGNYPNNGGYYGGNYPYGNNGGYYPYAGNSANQPRYYQHHRR